MQECTKNKLLTAALNIVQIHGWGYAPLLEEASKDICMPNSTGRLLFPYGNIALLEYYSQYIDSLMIADYHANTICNGKTHERIIQCITARLSLLSIDNGREVTARTISFLALPWNTTLALKILWKTVDLIWYEAGKDKSTDFNYYTKRILLGSVFTSTMIYWLTDDSAANDSTIRFLTNRIYNILSLGKMITKGQHKHTHVQQQ